MARDLHDQLTQILNEPGSISLDLELVYGHCWGSGPKYDPGNFKIDATRIPIRQT